MNELIHADIFFFITAIAVVIVTVGMVVVIYYVVVILQDIREVVAKIRKASDELEQDFEALRASVKNEGTRVRTIVELALGFIMRQIPKSRAKRKTKESASEEE